MQPHVAIAAIQRGGDRFVILSVYVLVTEASFPKSSLK